MAHLFDWPLVTLKEVSQRRLEQSTVKQPKTKFNKLLLIFLSNTLSGRTGMRASLLLHTVAFNQIIFDLDDTCNIPVVGIYHLNADLYFGLRKLVMVLCP